MIQELSSSLLLHVPCCFKQIWYMIHKFNEFVPLFFKCVFIHIYHNYCMGWNKKLLQNISTVQCCKNAYIFSNFHLNSVRMTTTKGIKKRDFFAKIKVFIYFQQKVLDPRVLSEKALSLRVSGISVHSIKQHQNEKVFWKHDKFTSDSNEKLLESLKKFYCEPL